MEKWIVGIAFSQSDRRGIKIGEYICSRIKAIIMLSYLPETNGLKASLLKGKSFWEESKFLTKTHRPSPDD
jgi:hypothetical protein